MSDDHIDVICTKPSSRPTKKLLSLSTRSLLLLAFSCFWLFVGFLPILSEMLTFQLF